MIFKYLVSASKAVLRQPLYAARACAVYFQRLPRLSFESIPNSRTHTSQERFTRKEKTVESKHWTIIESFLFSYLFRSIEYKFGQCNIVKQLYEMKIINGAR